MVYNTDDNIQIAIEHIKSADDRRIKYACLELREAIEKIAYQKLKLRLKKIAPEEINSWQPGKVMQILMELTDKNIGESFILNMASEGESENQQFRTIGKSTGINIKGMSKYWNKLGSHLHAKMPKKDKVEVSQKNSELEKFLNEVIEYIGEIANTKFDAFFSMNVTFHCSKCKKPIVRNRELLSDKDIVQCQNPNCIESYVVHIEDGNYKFELHQFPITCEECGFDIVVSANSLLEIPYKPYLPGKILECPKCKCKHDLMWHLDYRKSEASL